MNKKLLFVLVLNSMLIGCAQAPEADSSGPMADCKTKKPWLYLCRGNPAKPAATLNTKNGKLSAKPYCIKASEESEINFTLKPPGNKPLNTVHIFPKNPERDGWLKGSNDEDQDLITITVEKDLDHNLKYLYGIRTDTECVDPRIRVED